MRKFRNKTVFVTGAAGGLGRAICHRFAAAGAKIAAADLNEAAVQALEDELKAKGVQCRGYVLDVTDEKACTKVINQAAKDLGSLDVLVNNAGITHRSALEQTQVGVYKKVMDVNFFGSLYCTLAAMDNLIAGKGAIVVISSVAGVTPLLGRTGYSASKHALHGLFDSLRTELKDKGVSVTIVCPGFTATNIDKAALDFDGKPTKHPQSTVGKIATPQETANSVFMAAAKGKRLAVLSTIGWLSWVISRISPGLFENIMARSVGHELERD